MYVQYNLDMHVHQAAGGGAALAAGEVERKVMRELPGNGGKPMAFYQRAGGEWEHLDFGTTCTVCLVIPPRVTNRNGPYNARTTNAPPAPASQDAAVTCRAKWPCAMYIHTHIYIHASVTCMNVCRAKWPCAAALYVCMYICMYVCGWV